MEQQYFVVDCADCDNLANTFPVFVTDMVESAKIRVQILQAQYVKYVFSYRVIDYKVLQNSEAGIIWHNQKLGYRVNYS